MMPAGRYYIGDLCYVMRFGHVVIDTRGEEDIEDDEDYDDEDQ